MAWVCLVSEDDNDVDGARRSGGKMKEVNDTKKVIRSISLTFYLLLDTSSTFVRHEQVFILLACS
jgi:hypothetical protein